MSARILAFPQVRHSPDLLIVTQRYGERATVHAHTDRGLEWLNERFLGVVDGTLTISIEGTIDLEDLARASQIEVEIR